MDLELTNFKCWSSKKLTFPDIGLIGLFGNSGIGKSTIFQAIYFCLYGIGTKLCTYNEKSCKVKLKFNKLNLKISRSKGPKRLIVKSDNIKYENDVAQSIINTKFGDNFLLTSYIMQKGSQSFIYLSSTEKLYMLEKLSFGTLLNEIENMKKKTKLKIKELKETCQELVGQHSIINKEYKDIKKPDKVEKIEIIDDLPNKLLFSKNEYNNLLNEYSKYQKEFLIYKTNLSKLDSIKKDIKKNIDNKQSIKLIKPQDISILKSQLQIYDTHKKYLSDKENYLSNKINYENLLKLETNSYNSEFNLLKSKLNNEYESKLKVKELELNSLILFINKLKEYKKLDKSDIDSVLDESINLLNTLKNTKKELNDQLDYKYCPNCKISLKIINREIVNSTSIKKTKDDILKEIKEYNVKEKEIEDKIKLYNKYKLIDSNNIKICKLLKIDNNSNILSLLETKTNEYNILIKEISELKQLVNEQNIIKNKIKELKPESSTLLKLKQQLNNFKEKNIDLPKLSVNELKDLILQETLKKEIYDKNINDIKTIDMELSNLYNQQRHLNIKFTEIDYDSKLQEIKKNIDLYEKMKCYSEYKTKYDNYKYWKNKYLENLKLQKESQESLSNYETLHTKIIESESESLNDTINNINYYLKIFLDKLFLDPITIELSAYKETKKTLKPCISINIFYKEMKCDLNMLSGGEQDRVIVAFILALNEIYGHSLLLLDEALASLDSELVETILGILKEVSKNKLVMIVAHQTGEGLFDKIINVK